MPQERPLSEKTRAVQQRGGRVERHTQGFIKRTSEPLPLLIVTDVDIERVCNDSDTSDAACTDAPATFTDRPTQPLVKTAIGLHVCGADVAAE